MKKKALIKVMALLDSLNESDGDDEDGYETSSSVVPDPQRQLFGNSEFETQDYIHGFEDF